MGNSDLILYDTNILLDLYHNWRYAQSEVKKAGNRRGVLCSTVYLEMMAGIQTNKHRSDCRKFLAQYPMLTSTAEVDDYAMQIATSSLKSDRHVADCLIAATALAYQIPLFTANLRDFEGIHKNLTLIGYRSYSAYIQEGGGLLSEPDEPETLYKQLLLN